MVLCGKNAVEEAIKSGKKIEKVYLQHGKFFEPSFLEELERHGIRFQWAKKAQLEKLAGTKKHQGIVALLALIEYADLYELIEETKRRNSFFVALDGITEPQNLGAIARSVELFGGVGLLLPSKGSAPINQVAIKASAGALLHLKVARVEFLEEGLLAFKEEGGNVYALETGGRDIREVKFQFPLAIIVGAEGRGIDAELVEIADMTVTIPTAGKLPSLNAAVATGIAAWEVFKQGS
jgi:23S rRNA (guanosine2251-2'-O)-methyltransferase